MVARETRDLRIQLLKQNGNSDKLTLLGVSPAFRKAVDLARRVASTDASVMIEEIGSVKNVPTFISEVKSGKGGRLMGFGHRVYKSYDPRAKIVKQLANEVFDAVGMDRDLEIALELERIALSDDYFVSRKLYPNVDFYTGLIYRAMKFPTDFFTVLFAVARTSGWLAQWEEMLLDKEQKIARPRQVYTGYDERPYKSALDYRKKSGKARVATVG